MEHVSQTKQPLLSLAVVPRASPLTLQPVYAQQMPERMSRTEISAMNPDIRDRLEAKTQQLKDEAGQDWQRVIPDLVETMHSYAPISSQYKLYELIVRYALAHNAFIQLEIPVQHSNGEWYCEGQLISGPPCN